MTHFCFDYLFEMHYHFQLVKHYDFCFLQERHSNYDCDCQLENHFGCEVLPESHFYSVSHYQPENYCGFE